MSAHWGKDRDAHVCMCCHNMEPWTRVFIARAPSATMAYVHSKKASSRACVSPFPFFLFGAMAEEEEAPAPEKEYVSARYITLQGNEQMLAFPRGAALGAVFLYNHIEKNEREREAN